MSHSSIYIHQSHHLSPSMMQSSSGHAELPAAVVNHDCYPFSAPTACAAIHDLCKLQKMLSNHENFAAQTKCEIFEISENGTGAWTIIHDDDELQQFMNVGDHGHYFPCSLTLKISKENAVLAPARCARFW